MAQYGECLHRTKHAGEQLKHEIVISSIANSSSKLVQQKPSVCTNPNTGLGNIANNSVTPVVGSIAKCRI